MYVCVFAGSVLGHPQLGRPETWTVPLVGTDVTLVEQVEGFTKVRHQLLARPTAHISLPLSKHHSTSSMVSITHIHFFFMAHVNTLSIELRRVKAELTGKKQTKYYTLYKYFRRKGSYTITGIDQQ